MEGHFLRGYGDRSRDVTLRVLPGCSQEADLVLEEHPETRANMAKVFALIDGFETPYGLELLATVHWLAQTDATVRQDPAAAVKGVQEWSPRKEGLFSAAHIETAWNRLREQAWI